VAAPRKSAAGRTGLLRCADDWVPA